MKIFLTESEVIELAYDALDMIQPDPDKVHDIALRMDMVYSEELDMYEDIEEISLRKYKRVFTRDANHPTEYKTIDCPYCYGDGTWETECCNGSHGCSCRGQRVDMGPCNVCKGTGKVDPNNYDIDANRKMIAGACFIGSGPVGGWLPGSVSLGIGTNELPF